MKISIFPNNLPLNHKLVFPQIVSAIKNTDTVVENSMDADAALIWSVLWNGRMTGNKKVWDHYRNQNKPVLVIEVGGLLRNQSWKLGINGVNRDAEFGLVHGWDNQRLYRFNIKLKPWKDFGDIILIAGQHDKSQQWEHMPSLLDYYKQTVKEIRKDTDQKIIIRQHPRCKISLNHEWMMLNNVDTAVTAKVHGTYDDFDLEKTLESTFCTYSYCSNAGITSVLNGIPVVVSKHSLAYNMSSTNVLNLNKPDRYDWLCMLTYTEWFPDEINHQWKRLRNLL